MARGYYRKGDFDKAVEALNTIQSLKDDQLKAKASYNLGNTYARLKRNPEAIAAYIKAVQTDPGYMDAWVNLSILSFQEGDFANAVKYCDEAVLLGYQAPQGYLNALAPYRR